MIYFITLEQFNLLPASVVNELKASYNISFDEIDRSVVTDLYWTSTGEQAKLFQLPENNTRSVDMLTDREECVILRDKNSSTLSRDQVEENILNCPLTRLILYGNDDVSKIGKYRMIKQNDPSIETIRSKAVYKFPEMSILETNYLVDFLTDLKEKIYDEQEKVASSCADRLKILNMPKNQLINKFVTEIVLEKVPNPQNNINANQQEEQTDEDIYLIFVYEESRRTNDGERSPLDDPPFEIELMADVEMDEDDDLNEDDPGVEIDGVSFVRYMLTLEIDQIIN